MSRPGGNPGIKEFAFKKKNKWDEPCTDQLVVRVPPSMKKRVQTIDKWQEFVRVAIAEALEEYDKNEYSN